MIERKSLQAQAYDYIKNMVLDGKLEYNHVYSETKMAKELGISRTPMRDAVQYLSQERYIDIIPNKGFCLHQMSMQDFFETFQIRTAIEGYCARQLAEEISTEKAQETLVILKDCIEKQVESVAGSMDEFFAADALFHLTIVRYSNNMQLETMFQSYLYRMRNLSLQAYIHNGRRETALEEHKDILNSILSGNPDSSYNQVAIHMESPRNIAVIE